MKKVCFILLLLIIFTGCVTTPELAPEERRVQYIIDAPEKSKNDLYNLSGEWFAKTFRSAQNVVQYQNPEEGMIIGRGTMRGGVGNLGTIEFLLTIETKDGKARATFDDVYMVSGSMRILMLDNESSEKEFKKSSDPLIASLTQYLNTTIDEW